MSDNKVTLDQLDNSAVEAMSSSVGDVNMLNTENKTIVGALAEIVGKKEIANAIGEPLAETDKFTEMSSEINGLLSTFKTNMMNAGVVVESGDKFKALIDKIKGLTEGEGNKGMRFVSGHTTDVVFKTHTHTYTNSEGEEVTNSNKMFDIEIELDFDPSIILVASKFTLTTIGLSNDMESITICDKLEKNKIAFGEYSSENSDDFANSYILPPLVEENKYYLPIAFPGLAVIQLSNIKVNQCTWYAIGVGEEDTTLRDSLADILEDEGVEVLEEDTMADLIIKTDEEFDRKNANKGLDIISATELPATGRENQICVITDNPVNDFEVSQFEEDDPKVNDKIFVLLSNAKNDKNVVYGNSVKTSIYFLTITQGNKKVPSYIYKNNKWTLFTTVRVIIMENGTVMNSDLFGEFKRIVSYGSYGKFSITSEGYSLDYSEEICDGTFIHAYSNSISLADYSNMSVTIKDGRNGGSSGLDGCQIRFVVCDDNNKVIFASDTIYWDNSKAQGNTTFTIDLTNASVSGHLGIELDFIGTCRHIIITSWYLE